MTTNNEEIYKRAVYYHDFWRSHVGLEDDIYNDPVDTQFPVLSWNYRMSEIMGAILPLPVWSFGRLGGASGGEFDISRFTSG